MRQRHLDTGGDAFEIAPTRKRLKQTERALLFFGINAGSRCTIDARRGIESADASGHARRILDLQLPAARECLLYSARPSEKPLLGAPIAAAHMYTNHTTDTHIRIIINIRVCWRAHACCSRAARCVRQYSISFWARAQLRARAPPP